MGQLEVPALYRCRLAHVRYQPMRHRFDYTLHWWLVDVDDLPVLPGPLRWVTGFHGRDHLGEPQRPLRVNVDAYLAANGIDLAEGPVLMLAQPRTLGYAFDPVSFFFCHDRARTLACVVMEVRNTFGERHCYLLTPDAQGQTSVAKELFVSPFFPLDGSYHVTLRLDASRLRITVALLRPVHGADRPVLALTASVSGLRIAGATLLGSVLRPARLLSAPRTIALIHWQALQLRCKGAPPSRRRYHEPQPAVTPKDEVRTR